MTPLNRLNLRENWPLWVAIMLFTLAIMYFLFIRLSPLDYPFEGAIIYPFLLIFQATIIYLFCFTVVFLLITALWALFAISEGQISTIFVTALVLAGVVLVSNASQLVYVLIGLGVLIAIAVVCFRQSPKRAIALIFSAIAVIGLFFPALLRVFQDVYHRDSIVFNDDIYYLTQIEDWDWDCEEYYFVVYQCDSLGFICRPHFTSNRYGTCYGYAIYALPTNVSFTVDTSTTQLYLQLDDERQLITP